MTPSWGDLLFPREIQEGRTQATSLALSGSNMDRKEWEAMHKGRRQRAAMKNKMMQRNAERRARECPDKPLQEKALPMPILVKKKD